jgi:predicted ester cyclase
MITANQQLVLTWFERVWNQRRREAIAEMLDPAFVMHDGDRESKGVAGFEAFFDQLCAAFSQIGIIVDDLIGEGDTVCARWTSFQRHTGAGMGVQPTGRAFHLTGISIVRVENGKFVEAWQMWDALKMMTEIGALKRAAGA